VKSLIIFCTLFLAACSTLEKPKVVDTSALPAGIFKCGPTFSGKIELERLGEKLRASALMQITPIETVIVSFWSSRSGDRDWTVLIEGKNGRSCMVLYGTRWLTVGQES
jgi:hypothetical protein